MITQNDHLKEKSSFRLDAKDVDLRRAVDRMKDLERTCSRKIFFGNEISIQSTPESDCLPEIPDISLVMKFATPSHEDSSIVAERNAKKRKREFYVPIRRIKIRKEIKHRMRHEKIKRRKCIYQNLSRRENGNYHGVLSINGSKIETGLYFQDQITCAKAVDEMRRDMAAEGGLSLNVLSVNFLNAEEQDLLDSWIDESAEWMRSELEEFLYLVSHIGLNYHRLAKHISTNRSPQECCWAFTKLITLFGDSLMKNIENIVLPDRLCV